MANSCSLLALPEEVLTIIARHTAKWALVVLSETCRQLRDVAEDALYRVLTLDNAEAPEHILFSIYVRPRRLQAIREININCEIMNLHDVDAIIDIIKRSPNLKTLRSTRLESANDDGATYLNWHYLVTCIFRAYDEYAVEIHRMLGGLPLAKLQTCIV